MPFYQRHIDKIIRCKNVVLGSTIVCLQLGVLFAHAQQSDPYLAKIRSTHKTIDNAKIESVSQVFRDGNLKQAISSDTSRMWIAGDQSKVVTQNLEMVVNDKYLITVNHNLKLIQYQTIPNAEKDKEPQLLQNIDSLFDNLTKPTFADNLNGLLHYRLVRPNQLYEVMDIYFDENTYLLKRVFVEYNAEMIGKKISSSVDYLVFDLHADFAPGYFGENQYMQKSNSGWSPSEEYENYSIKESKVYVQ